jgi:hypothetical protein
VVNWLGYYSKTQMRQNLNIGKNNLSNLAKYGEFYIKMARIFQQCIQIAVTSRIS